MSKVAYKIQIRGNVQGVCYRTTMQSEAKKQKLSGWVKNCEDGTVEAYIEGKAKDIEKMVSWCQLGPENARVDRVDIEPCALQNLSGFKIN